jgi:lipocalin
LNRKTYGFDYVKGYAQAPNQNEPNRLLVTLPVYNGVIKVVNTGEYNVLETDYTTYSVVYSCRNLFMGFKYEITWILGRNKTLDCNIVSALKKKLKKKGIDTNSFIQVDQTCNN